MNILAVRACGVTYIQVVYRFFNGTCAMLSRHRVRTALIISAVVNPTFTDVDTMIIARGTPGFSGADLSNMVKYGWLSSAVNVLPLINASVWLQFRHQRRGRRRLHSSISNGPRYCFTAQICCVSLLIYCRIGS